MKRYIKKVINYLDELDGSKSMLRDAELVPGPKGTGADKMGISKAMGDEYVDKVTKTAAKKPRKKRTKKSRNNDYADRLEYLARESKAKERAMYNQDELADIERTRDLAANRMARGQTGQNYNDLAPKKPRSRK